jgi:hypothetical protein
MLTVFNFYVIMTVSKTQHVNVFLMQFLGYQRIQRVFATDLFTAGGMEHYTSILLYDMFVDCNWVATRWQQYSTHLHTNSTQSDKMKQNT